MILSDGDVVFQPRKIERSGLWAAVEGDVLIYIHKEQMLDDVERRYPARHYVMVDDKLRILTAMKAGLGRPADDGLRAAGPLRARPALVASLPPADVTVEAIGDLVNFRIRDLRISRLRFH